MMIKYPIFTIIPQILRKNISLNLTIKPRRWWQFGDLRRINKRIRKLATGGTLFFCPGVYKIKKSIYLSENISLNGQRR